ncbi:MAG: hypothetical protein IH845_00765 [Nanoarchaeota archaeon]|nr:hypothetical protein [Nanoarchaeota archaeon]
MLLAVNVNKAESELEISLEEKRKIAERLARTAKGLGKSMIRSIPIHPNNCFIRIDKVCEEGLGEGLLGDFDKLSGDVTYVRGIANCRLHGIFSKGCYGNITRKKGNVTEVIDLSTLEDI